MKRKYITLLLCLAALLTVSILGGTLLLGQRPFRNLSAGDISHVSVCLTPPDVTVELSAQQTEALTEILRRVVIYRRDDSYTEYSGQGVVFTITYVGGEQTAVTAYNPFLIIDGAGYQTKYGPCNELNAFANRLIS